MKPLTAILALVWTTGCAATNQQARLESELLDPNMPAETTATDEPSGAYPRQSKPRRGSVRLRSSDSELTVRRDASYPY
jgi:hypothetical protein